MKPRTDRGLLAILGLALCLRAGVLLLYPRIDLWFDEILHYAAAVLTAEFGLTVVGHWGPAYDALLAALFAGAGPDPAFARWLQVLLSTATVAGVYGIARPHAGVRVARIAALLCALHPSLVAFSHYLYSETLFIALLVGSLWALFGVASPSAGRAALAGGLFGVATLTRSVGLYYWPVWIAFLAWRGRKYAAQGELRAPLIAFAATLAVLAPWTLRNALTYGDFLLVDGTLGHSLALAYSDRERPFNIDLGYGLDPDPERSLPCAFVRAPGRTSLPATTELLALFPADERFDARARRRLPNKVERIREFAAQDTPALQRCEVAHALAFARAHPAAVARASLARGYALWGPNSFLLRSIAKGAYDGGPLARGSYPFWKGVVFAAHVLVVGAALLGLGRTPLSLPVLWIAGFALYYTAGHTLTVAYSRYHLPLVPLASIPAAVWLAAPRRPAGAREWGAAGLAGAFLVLCVHYAATRLP